MGVGEVVTEDAIVVGGQELASDTVRRHEQPIRCYTLELGEGVRPRLSPAEARALWECTGGLSTAVPMHRQPLSDAALAALGRANVLRDESDVSTPLG